MITSDFKKWLKEEKESQKGKWPLTFIFLFLPIFGDILLLKVISSKDVIVVPEIGINKPLFFIQAVIFKYLLWFVGIMLYPIFRGAA